LAGGIKLKKTDAAVQVLISEIESKDILEVACGAAEFSNSAANYARSVSCIDLDDNRFSSAGQNNLYFKIMDAAKMEYSDEMFDNVFLYNALSHVQLQWEAIERECRRVLKPEGSIYIIGTWKLDIALITEMFGDKIESDKGFLIVRIYSSKTGKSIWLAVCSRDSLQVLSVCSINCMQARHWIAATQKENHSELNHEVVKKNWINDFYLALYLDNRFRFI